MRGYALIFCGDILRKFGPGLIGACFFSRALMAPFCIVSKVSSVDVPPHSSFRGGIGFHMTAGKGKMTNLEIRLQCFAVLK